MNYTITPKHVLVLFIFALFYQIGNAHNISDDILSNTTILDQASMLEDDDCSETAFALLNSDDDPSTADTESSCFIPQFNRWGWTTLLDFSEDTGESSYNLSFYAGAGQCNLSSGTDVGSVTVTHNGDDTVTFEYELSAGFLLSEAHIYLGTEMYPVGNNGSQTVAPGQYNFVDSELGDVENYSVTLPAESNQIYVIIHGVVKDADCPDEGCPDSDDDGVCDTDDVCPGFDDNIDSDGDGIPDGCDSGGGVFRNYSFKLFPIPFDEAITIQYRFDYETNVDIEVINTQGMKIARMSNDNYNQGTVVNTPLRLSSYSDQLLFVRITTSKDEITKKIISFK